VLQAQRSIPQTTESSGAAGKNPGAYLSGHPLKETKTVDIARNLFDTLKTLCVLLNRSRIDYCLIGGLAVAILAKPRATEDIDLLILMDEQERPTIASLIKKKFEVIQDNNVMHFENATIWRIVLASPVPDATGFVIVDFLLADNDIYREAVRSPINLTLGNVTIPVASPENLIRIKELSNRPQDLLDIASLKESLDRK
jgi:hypothetical protein